MELDSERTESARTQHSPRFAFGVNWLRPHTPSYLKFSSSVSSPCFSCIPFGNEELKCPLDVCLCVCVQTAGSWEALEFLLSVCGGCSSTRWQAVPGIRAPRRLPCAQLIHFLVQCLAPENIWVSEWPGAV